MRKVRRMQGWELTEGFQVLQLSWPKLFKKIKKEV
jgi:hypothetical protein